MKLKKLNLKKFKRVSEAIENILIIGIIVALIVTVFYPNLNTTIGRVLNGINSWVNNMTNSLFQ